MQSQKVAAGLLGLIEHSDSAVLLSLEGLKVTRGWFISDAATFYSFLDTYLGFYIYVSLDKAFYFVESIISIN